MHPVFMATMSGETVDPQARAEADRLFFAWEAVEDALSLAFEANDADQLVRLLVALADAVPGDEAALAYLGAGPVEDALHGCRSDEHQALADAIDSAASRNSNLQLAVRCVYWSDDSNPAVVARFARFGPPLEGA
jgi:hypothetical protein